MKLFIKTFIIVLSILVLLFFASIMFAWKHVSNDAYKYKTNIAIYNYIIHNGRIIVHLPNDATGTISVKCSNPAKKIVVEQRKVGLFLGHDWIDIEIIYMSSAHQLTKLVVS